MQLRDDDALGAVDDEGAAFRHVRHRAEVDLLLDGLDGFFAVFLLLARQAERGLQRDVKGQSLRDALLHGVLRRVEVVINELERVAPAAVFDRKVLVEHRLQTDVFTVFGR